MAAQNPPSTLLRHSPLLPTAPRARVLSGSHDRRARLVVSVFAVSLLLLAARFAVS